MHKVFISYHHENDQIYKDRLVRMGKQYEIFIDRSVNTGDISDRLSPEAIREKIRDEYLRDSTVTIVLVGTETKGRKHVDWEIYSSMIDGKVNKKSGILVVNLPRTDCTYYTATRMMVRKRPSTLSLTKDGKPSSSRAEYERRYPCLPDRIIDNLLKVGAKVSVTSWSKISNPDILKFLVDATFQDRQSCEYDFSSPMRRANS